MDVNVDTGTQRPTALKETSKSKIKITSVQEICRLCGEHEENCISIFDNQLSIAEKISRCLPIIVLADDDLPSHICKKCFAYLNISYKLIVNSLEVETKLRKKMKNKKATQKSYLSAKNKQTPLSKEMSAPISMKKLKKYAIHGPVNCEFCSVDFTDVKKFDQHFEKEHILTWKCTLCDDSFQTSDELIRHKSISHNGNILICKSCVDEEGDQERIILNMKKETDNFSSGEEYEEKFYIPAEPPRVEDSNLKKPTTSYSTDKTIKSETCSINNEAKTLISTATFELTSTFLSNSIETTSIAALESSTDTPVINCNQNSNSSPANNNGPSNTLVDDNTRRNNTGRITKPSFDCDICHLQLNDKKLFDLHKRIHLPKFVVCVLCKKEFQTIYDLYLHKKEAHKLYSKVNLKYVCDKCGKFFSNSWQWETHKTQKCRHREGDNKCKYCTSSFSTSCKLKRHLRKHKQEMFSDPSVKVFKCVSCPKIFVDEEFYQKHRNVHDPECWNNFKCKICDRSFRDNVRLREHMKSIHEGVKPHTCDVCSKSFHRLSNMKAHRALHFGHKCPHCDRNFEKIRQLANHIQEDHGLEPPASLLTKKGYVSGTHICKFCGRTLATHQSLLDHEHIHTGEKPYPCEICDKNFRSYTARWSHMQRHNKGNFICEQCGKCFSFKQNLMTHIQVHLSMEDRKHQCLRCNKRFLRKAHLDVHMRIHEGIRPYTCDICHFSFTQIGDMRRHRARHTSGEVIKKKSRMKTEVTKIVSETSNDDTN